MNMRQIQIFFNFFEANDDLFDYSLGIIHMFCKNCEPEIVFVLICTLAEQFHVHKSYKTRESTFFLRLKFGRKYKFVSYSFSCR